MYHHRGSQTKQLKPPTNGFKPVPVYRFQIGLIIEIKVFLNFVIL